MENVDDALIAAPEMVRMTEVDAVGLHNADKFATLLEPASTEGVTEGTKK